MTPQALYQWPEKLTHSLEDRVQAALYRQMIEQLHPFVAAHHDVLHPPAPPPVSVPLVVNGSQLEEAANGD